MNAKVKKYFNTVFTFKTLRDHYSISQLSQNNSVYYANYTNM